MRHVRRRPPSLRSIARRSFSRATGIPTTRRGLERRAFRLLTGGRRRRPPSGCLVSVLGAVSLCALLAGGLILLF